jgi:hypothetical protein
MELGGSSSLGDRSRMEMSLPASGRESALAIFEVRGHDPASPFFPNFLGRAVMFGFDSGL